MKKIFSVAIKIGFSLETVYSSNKKYLIHGFWLIFFIEITFAKFFHVFLAGRIFFGAF